MTRDVCLLTIGFFLGAVIMALLSTPSAPTRLPGAPATGVVGTGPVLAAASRPPHVFAISNMQWQASPAEIILPAALIVISASLLTRMLMGLLAELRTLELSDATEEADAK